MSRNGVAGEKQKMLALMPIAPLLSAYLEQAGHLRGLPIAWHCHLTEQTAVFVEVLTACGVRLYMSEADAQTTNAEAVACMRELGAQVFLGSQSVAAVLAAEPVLLADTGLVLISAYTQAGRKHATAGSEITTSGITRLRADKRITLPVINLNDGVLKPAIENFHGVGSGLVEALAILGLSDLAGVAAAVCGYGAVGRGAAHYLAQAGCHVQIVECDPRRSLIAHFDGYALTPLPDALSTCPLVVTATGQAGLISRPQFAYLRDRQLLVNIGHWATEIDLEALGKTALSVDDLDRHRRAYRLAADKVVTVACQGSPANVALLTGRPEPTLIHITTELLCMSYLSGLAAQGAKLPGGEHPLPEALERQTSDLALSALANRPR